MVISSPCLTNNKNWLVQKQTAFGKDFSNPFMADSLPKTICNEALTIPEQTATGKEISNPFTADWDLQAHDPLALMANSNNPYNYPMFYQDQPSLVTYMQQPPPNNNYNPQPSLNMNYMQQPMSNPEDIIDPKTIMYMELVLIAKAFKLNYSTPTNNNQRILSNPHNRQIAQPGMNLGPDRQMHMVGGDLDEIEEVNANCILMANLQQASTLGSQTDNAPVYDSDGSIEKSLDDNLSKTFKWEKNMRNMVMMKKIDGLNNEKGEKKWQSMVLQMKFEEIMCSKREVPARV
ncbi:hypothetical protein Tco_0449098 [Tanacetum coccineum]